MKKYKCKLCKKGKWTTRKEARKCIRSHVKTDKRYRDHKRSNSNITENQEKEDFL